jgi:hypothetical protein
MDAPRAFPEWGSGPQLSTIRNWYAIRNEIAHGDPPSQLFDVPPVLHLADAIGASLARVLETIAKGSR